MAVDKEAVLLVRTLRLPGVLGEEGVGRKGVCPAGDVPWAEGVERISSEALFHRIVLLWQDLPLLCSEPGSWGHIQLGLREIPGDRTGLVAFLGMHFEMGILCRRPARDMREAWEELVEVLEEPIHKGPHQNILQNKHKQRVLL